MTFALIAGRYSMAVLMSILNYYVFLPAYTSLWDGLRCRATEARQYRYNGILPFNLIKGALITFIFMLAVSLKCEWTWTYKKAWLYNKHA